MYIGRLYSFNLQAVKPIRKMLVVNSCLRHICHKLCTLCIIVFTVKGSHGAAGACQMWLSAVCSCLGLLQLYHDIFSLNMSLRKVMIEPSSHHVVCCFLEVFIWEFNYIWHPNVWNNCHSGYVLYMPSACCSVFSCCVRTDIVSSYFWCEKCNLPQPHRQEK